VSAIDTAVLVLRVWLGVVMPAHALICAQTLPGTTRWLASKGFRHAGLNARASAVGEVAAGAAARLTLFAAAGAVAVMTVAFGAIHRFAGFFVFMRPDEG
jgi:uncharacterized membrane protein YphA (DoxX/SURF4 family)